MILKNQRALGKIHIVTSKTHLRVETSHRMRGFIPFSRNPYEYEHKGENPENPQELSQFVVQSVDSLNCFCKDKSKQNINKESYEEEQTANFLLSHFLST